jgi:hypothetical protein
MFSRRRSFLPKRQKNADFLEENSRRPRNLSLKTRKGWLPKKLASKLKKLELNSTNLRLKRRKNMPRLRQKA